MIYCFIYFIWLLFIVLEIVVISLQLSLGLFFICLCMFISFIVYVVFIYFLEEEYGEVFGPKNHTQNIKLEILTLRFTLTGNPGRALKFRLSAFNVSYRQACIGFPASELFVRIQENV